MSSYSTLKRACLGLVIALTLGAGVAAAQDVGTVPQDGAPNQRQREGRRRGPDHWREHWMIGLMRGLRELDLTEAQQQQTRAIFARFADSTKPQREALEQLREKSGPPQETPTEETSARAKQLRGEIREAMLSARSEVLAILTPEQRTKLEQREQERKARQEKWRSRQEQSQPPQ